MSGAKRKIQRAKKKRAEKELQEKMNMFDKLGDACMTCDKPFDKKDREQVQSWNVVVRKKENKVNLYCPINKPNDSSIHGFLGGMLIRVPTSYGNLVNY